MHQSAASHCPLLKVIIAGVIEIKGRGSWGREVRAGRK